MFGHTITLGGGQSGNFVPAPPSPASPAFASLTRRWSDASAFPIRQPSRDYAADIPIPQTDRVTRALLTAIF
jgi:hypothetical protein